MHFATRHDDISSPSSDRWPVVQKWFENREPRPVRGPFTRWPRATDALVAVVVFLGSAMTVALSQLGEGEDLTADALLDRPAGAFVMLAAAASLLLLRRRRPVLTAVLVATVLLGWALAGYGDGHDLPLIVAIYSVGRYTSDERASLLTLTGVAVASVLATIIDPNQRIDVAPALLLSGIPWYVGRRIRDRGAYLALLQERAERLEADQQARAREAVATERSRIARELHDVVAHQVSMMTIQAGAARTVAGDDLEAAIEAMSDVESAGRQALGELRHLLGVLRPSETDGDDLGPQPGVADLPDLADQLSHTGANVTLTIGDLPDRLPSALDLSVYRIAQESITNIVKHAGPEPTVVISVVTEDHVLVLTVSNTTSRRSPGLPSSGYGIVGMTERARLLGGTLTAEERSPDHFTVQARLPLEPELP